MPADPPFWHSSAVPGPASSPSPEALAWACAQAGGGPVIAGEFLGDGISHRNYALTLGGSTSQQVVLRWRAPAGPSDDWTSDAIVREASALAVLERAGYPAPRLIAADPAGRHCGRPALLMTRLRGEQPDYVTARSPSFAPQLAAAALELHRIPLPEAGFPAYQPYYDPKEMAPPPNSARPGIWERAFAAVSTAPWPCAVFIHRDYHAGNTLWSDARLTGVVDWASVSQGPVGVDVGHMRCNLVAAGYCVDADRFLDHYVELSDGDYAHDPYWDLLAAVDMLPDAGFSRDCLERLEPYLDAALAML